MSIERAALEAEIKHLREHLAAYEAEPVIAYEAIRKSNGDCELLYERKHDSLFDWTSLIQKPTSTSHLEAVKAQVWDAAMEAAIKAAQAEHNCTAGSKHSIIEAIRAAKKGEQHD